MISAHNIHKTFTQKGKPAKTVSALNSMGLRAENGQITALLGPNGAGKTTFLRMLAGLEHADSGDLEIDGYDIRKQPSRIAYLSDGCGLYPKLTAYENIVYFAELYGMTLVKIQQRIEFLDASLQLAPLLTRKVAGFSLGERMRVSIARALIHDPQTIVLDEPTNGLDLSSVRKLRAFLQFLASPQGGNKCILFSTHIMHEVEKIAHQVYVIVAGQIKAQGSVDEIVAQTACDNFEDAFVSLAFTEDR